MHADCMQNFKAFFTTWAFIRFFQICVLTVLTIIGTINVIFLITMKESITPVLAASSLSFIGIMLRYTSWASKAFVETDNYLVSPLRLLEYQNLDKEY